MTTQYSIGVSGNRRLVLSVNAAHAPPVTDDGDINPPPPDTSWTDYTAHATTRIVYVSTSGSDAADGLTDTTPKQTLSAGYALIRDGYPDWLLLKRGDTWSTSLPTWKKSGLSATYPQVISYYGSTASARPILNTGVSSAFATEYGPSKTYALRYISIIGLDCNSDTYTGTGGANGIDWKMPGSDLLIEDCRFLNYKNNISIQGIANSIASNLTTCTIRRCVIADAYSTDSHSQGIFLAYTNSWIIEENILDHNGWKEGLSGAEATIYNRNVYIANSCGAGTFRQNVTARSASEGIQQRSGGLMYDNICCECSAGLQMGQWQSSWPTQAVGGSIYNNVILDSHDINGSPRGTGIMLEQCDGVLIYSNIIAHLASGTGNKMAIGFGSTTNNCKDINIYDNIVYDWAGGACVNIPAACTVSGYVYFTNNYFQQTTTGTLITLTGHAWDAGIYASTNNDYYTAAGASTAFLINATSQSYATWVTNTGETGSTNAAASFPAPTRDIPAYQTSIGGTATLAAYLTSARTLTRYAWTTNLTTPVVLAWLQAGYR